jgi:TetR/AcrR family transcriptional repressor of bet genes
VPIPVTEKNLASRNRKQQSEFRKSQLIEATMDCIDKFGLSQTTLARIAERAQLSQGNIVFHFQSKDSLLEQTLRFLSEEYRSNWQETSQLAGDDPIARLCALIKASFSKKICNRRKISVWYAFWGESRSRPKYMNLCGSNDRAFSDNLLGLCEQLESFGGSHLSPGTAALSIEGMIDGLWQNFLIGPPGFKRAQACATVFDLLEVIYPSVLVQIRDFSGGAE